MYSDFYLFRTSLTTILTNIVTKKHDKDACNTNCKENGKFFNHEPHQCPYFTGSSRFNNFVEKKVIDDEDSSEATTKNSPNIAEYCFQMMLLNEFMLRYTSCHQARTARRSPYGAPFYWRAPRGTIKCTNSKRSFKS